MVWKEMNITDTSEAPMKMSGCGMVAYGDHKLVLFGGFAMPGTTGEQAASALPRRGEAGDGNAENGWSNELKVFDLQECKQSVVVLHVALVYFEL